MKVLLALLGSNWKPALGLVALLLAFGSGWTVNNWRWEAKHAAELQAAITEHEKAEAAAHAKAAALEHQLATLQDAFRDLSRRTADETNKPDYRCGLPPGGLRLRSEAIAGPGPGQPHPGLPGPP